MARQKVQRILQTFVRTPTTPPTDNTANTATDNTITNYILGKLQQVIGADWYSTPPTDLTAAKAHLDSVDGTAHGGVINRVQAASTDMNKRRKINFTGSGVTVTDDSAGDRVNVSISSGGAGGTDHTLLSTFHTDTLSADTPVNGDVVRRVSGVWEASPITDANVASANVNGPDGTPSLRSLGTSAGQALPGNHADVHAKAHTLLSNTDHTDVTTGLVPADGDGLKWNAATAKWILSPPSTTKGLIQGLALTYDGANTLGVETGEAYVPGLGKLLEVETRITKTVSFPASSVAFHYVYLIETAGVPDVEITTTAPVAYRGYAKQQTGNSSARYLGAILPNGATSPTMIKWMWQPGNFVRYLHPFGSSPLEVLDLTALTVGNTLQTVSVANQTPPTATSVELYAGVDDNNSSTSRGVQFSTPEASVAPTTYTSNNPPNALFFLRNDNPSSGTNDTATAKFVLPLGASRSFTWLNDGDSGVGRMQVGVTGYQEAR